MGALTKIDTGPPVGTQGVGGVGAPGFGLGDYEILTRSSAGARVVTDIESAIWAGGREVAKHRRRDTSQD